MHKRGGWENTSGICSLRGGWTVRDHCSSHHPLHPYRTTTTTTTGRRSSHQRNSDKKHLTDNKTHCREGERGRGRERALMRVHTYRQVKCSAGSRCTWVELFFTSGTEWRVCVPEDRWCRRCDPVKSQLCCRSLCLFHLIPITIRTVKKKNIVSQQNNTQTNRKPIMTFRRTTESYVFFWRHVLIHEESRLWHLCSMRVCLINQI